MGCAQSRDVVITIRTELVDLQPEKTKYQLKVAIKRDDPVLFQNLMKSHDISLQEKLNDEFDTNWTFLHFAAAKNAYKVIKQFLNSSLSSSQLPFDIVNARDLSGLTPLQTAFDYSSLEAFRTLLHYCAKYDHKVALRNNFLQSIPDDSEYLEAIKAYKNKTLDMEIDQPDSSQDIKTYTIISNRGQPIQAEAQMIGNNHFQDKEFWNKNNEFLQEHRKDSEEKDLKKSWSSLAKIQAEFKIFEKGEFNPNRDLSSSLNPNLSNLFCAISEYPSFFQNIFTKSDPEHGLFSFILYQDGLPKLLLLDDNFPTAKNNKDLLFQKPFGDEFWPLFLEKALAKLFGGYQKIVELSFSELLEAVFGAPVKSFNLNDNSVDILWMILQDFNHDNCMAYVESKNDKGNFFLICDLISFNEKRIVKLKACQPNAKILHDVSGEAFDQEERGKMGFETKEEGYWLINFEDFVEQFEKTTVSHYNGKWSRTAALIQTLGTKAENFDLEIKKDCKIFLSFFQKVDAEHPALPLHFVLLQRDSIEIKTIAEGDSNCQLGSRICEIKNEENLNLEPGKYIVQVKAISKAKKAQTQSQSQTPGTLVAYSSQPITLTPIQNKSILEEILISLGESSLKEPCGTGCEFASGSWSIYHWFYFENNSSSKWEVEMKFESLSNLKLGKLFRKTKDSFQILIEKNEKKVVYLEKKNLQKPTDFKFEMEHIFDGKV